MAHAPDKTAIIVSHGQPSAPEGPERAMAALAARVARHLAGWGVHSATLAAPGALAAAVSRAGPAARIYPLFMTDGWFVSVNLPRKLREAGGGACRILPPLGLDPRVPELMLGAARAAAAEEGLDPARTPLLLVAHGSPSNPRPKQVTEDLAAALRGAGGFARIVTGYVDETPGIADAAREAPGGICLPFFAASNGHMLEDVPGALAEGGYRGRVLPPLGEWDSVPAMIAGALRADAEATEAGTRREDRAATSR